MVPTYEANHAATLTFSTCMKLTFPNVIVSSVLYTQKENINQTWVACWSGSCFPCKVHATAVRGSPGMGWAFKLQSGISTEPGGPLSTYRLLFPLNRLDEYKMLNNNKIMEVLPCTDLVGLCTNQYTSITERMYSLYLSCIRTGMLYTSDPICSFCFAVFKEVMHNNGDILQGLLQCICPSHLSPWLSGGRKKVGSRLAEGIEGKCCTQSEILGHSMPWVSYLTFNMERPRVRTPI